LKGLRNQILIISYKNQGTGKTKTKNLFSPNTIQLSFQKININNVFVNNNNKQKTTTKRAFASAMLKEKGPNSAQIHD